MKEKITIGNFLLTRLYQLGVEDIFGVPGDFNMEFLDNIEDHPKVNWIGCCNELNASYAADGYSRIKGMGCVVTTFGVGELSAINGCAGSYSEMVKVVNIIGSPSLKLQKEKAVLHHTLGNGNFDAFKTMYDHVTCDSFVVSERDAQERIDTALLKCISTSRPIYISLPTDICNVEIEADLNPLKLDLEPNDQDAEEEAMEKIIQAIEKSVLPVVLVDACVQRHNVMKEFEEFCNVVELPVVEAPMGKASFEGKSQLYKGVYVGVATPNASTKQLIESSDLILSFGAVKSDFNTGGFSYKLSTKHTIEFHSDHILVFNATYKKVGMKELIPKLTKKLKSFSKKNKSFSDSIKDNQTIKNAKGIITQNLFWDKMQDFLQEGDIVVADTGTSGYGILNIKFPKNCSCITQFLWGSIGFSVGAALGAAVAAKKASRRVILFVGDGSFQLTAQALSTMGKNDLDVYIFIINNDGYTIERYIHGETRKYNDIQMWDYSKGLEYFGIKDKGKASKVKTEEELSSIPETKSKGINLIEVFIPKMDAPETLKVQASITAKSNYE